MADFDKTISQRRFENLLGNLLRFGVMFSGAVVLFGGIFYLAGHGRAIPVYHKFLGEPAGLKTIGGILKGVFSFDVRAIIQLGILILIATPVARVAFSVVAFIRERDTVYIFVTIIVLATLIFSLSGGKL
jgi:uncharacterized membrane protein